MRSGSEGTDSGAPGWIRTGGVAVDVFGGFVFMASPPGASMMPHAAIGIQPRTSGRRLPPQGPQVENDVVDLLLELGVREIARMWIEIEGVEPVSRPGLAVAGLAIVPVDVPARSDLVAEPARRRVAPRREERWRRAPGRSSDDFSIIMSGACLRESG